MQSSSKSIGEEARDGALGKVAGRADAGKRILHTIDPEMMQAWGRVLAFGAQKYHQRNFMVAPGMAWGRVYDSLQGHLLKFWAGEWLDEESGEPHLAHVLCNLQFLWTYHEHEVYHPSDDRPSSVEYAGKTYAEWERAFKIASGVPDPLEGCAPVDPLSPAAFWAEESGGPTLGQMHSLTRLRGIVSLADKSGKPDAWMTTADLANVLSLIKVGK